MTPDEVRKHGAAKEFADYLQKEAQQGYELIPEQKLTTLTERIRSAPLAIVSTSQNQLF